MKARKRSSLWKTLSSKYIYESKWLKLRHDKTLGPDGRAGTYDVVEKNHFILIIPRIKDKYYLVEQYRYPVKKRSIEFPQGHVEKGEQIKTALNRELKEETGLSSNNIINLGFLWLAPGHHTQGFYVYLAEDCIATANNKHSGTESDMLIKVMSLKEIRDRIIDGTIKDSPTVAAFSLLSFSFHHQVSYRK